MWGSISNRPCSYRQICWGNPRVRQWNDSIVQCFLAVCLQVSPALQIPSPVYFVMAVESRQFLIFLLFLSAAFRSQLRLFTDPQYNLGWEMSSYVKKKSDCSYTCLATNAQIFSFIASHRLNKALPRWNPFICLSKSSKWNSLSLKPQALSTRSQCFVLIINWR